MPAPAPLPILATGPAVHVAVDMQRLFAEKTEWHVPDLDAITGNVAALAEAAPTVFARFVVPQTPEHASGRWRQYYRRWECFTGERLAPGMLDLVAPLARLARPDTVFDKPTYSAFESAAFRTALERTGAEVLIVTGVETDVCVLATVLDALDHGFHVVAVADAMASSSPPAHQATIAHVLPRFDVQIDVADTATVLATLGARP
jgi:nicotinamidase-related amidase